jgi:hypothetical protein
MSPLALPSILERYRLPHRLRFDLCGPVAVVSSSQR